MTATPFCIPSEVSKLDSSCKVARCNGVPFSAARPIIAVVPLPPGRSPQQAAAMSGPCGWRCSPNWTCLRMEGLRQKGDPHAGSRRHADGELCDEAPAAPVCIVVVWRGGVDAPGGVGIRDSPRGRLVPGMQMPLSHPWAMYLTGENCWHKTTRFNRVASWRFEWLRFSYLPPRKKKGFVIPTKSFVKIGITKIFCYNMFSSINKTFGCCSKIFGWSNKNSFVVPNFVTVTKPFFPESHRLTKRSDTRGKRH